MKKVVSLLLALFLLLSLGTGVSAAEDQLIYDDADLLTPEEEAAVAEELERVSRLHDTQIVVATVDSTGNMTADEYAEYFYDAKDLGYGPDRDGVLLLLSMDSRDYWIQSYGYAGDYINVTDINKIAEVIVPYLSGGAYADAFVLFADQCDRYLTPLSSILPASDTLLHDGADLLTEEEETELTELLQQASQLHGLQFIVSIVDFYDSYSVQYFAETYYESAGFGYGADHDGVLLLICTDTKEFQILSNGRAADAINDHDREFIGACIVPELAVGSCADAVREYVAMCTGELDSFAAHPASGETLLYDDADLLTSGDEDIVTAELRRVSSKYDAQVVIYTVDSLEDMTADEYVEYLYNSKGFGYGADHAGALLLVSKDTGEYRIWTSDWTSSSLNSYDIESLGETISPLLTSEDYLSAFTEYITACEENFHYHSPHGLIWNDHSWKRHLYDEANLLTDEETINLIDQLIDYSEGRSGDILVATVDSIGDASIDDFITEYYISNDMGYGVARSGVLLLLCMESGEYRILTRGTAAEIIDASVIEEIGEEITPYLNTGSYYDAFFRFASQCHSELLYYDFDSDDRNYDSEDKTVLTILMIALSAASIATTAMRSQLKSVHKAPHANVYTKADSMKLTGQSDLYLYSSVHRERIDDDSDSSGSRSGGRGGGGGSRSGGGGKF